MNVTVRLFAGARDLAGKSTVTVDLPADANVGDLRRRLALEWPRMAGIVQRSAFAVADEFAEDSLILSAGAEIALLPPVSGG